MSLFFATAIYLRCNSGILFLPCVLLCRSFGDPLPALREIGNRGERQVFREKFRGSAIVLARGNENREIFFIRQQNHTEIGPKDRPGFRPGSEWFRIVPDIPAVRNIRYDSVTIAGFPVPKYPWCVEQLQC
jgi:hypothetical protein